jgi:alkylation response protein AidB-like acyl-CoA dehydrogenase
LIERSMGAGLRVLNVLAGSALLDRMGVRRGVERALFVAARDGARSAGAASRTFKAARRLGRPARQQRSSGPKLFDLTPDDEQKMLAEMVAQFAAEAVRPVALEADDACAAPPELLDQSAELGVTMLGIPEELDGVLAERSAVTTVLVAEAFAHGDMGIAVAAMAPGAVATALALWGDADQQSTYLPAFTGEKPPPAALALLEPRAAYDPLQPSTKARRDGGDWVLSGVKSLVPRAAEDELFVVSADAEGLGPALFVVESSSQGLFTEPEPAMGLRAAATGRVVLEDVRVPAGALLGDGSLDVVKECVQRARIAWSAVAVGTSQAVLDYVIPYVNERKAFGEPISYRQAVAFSVADMKIELGGMRLATLRAASRADRGEDFGREAALAHRLCADRGMGIGSDGVQLLGGHGYVKEHPVERWYRDLRAAGLMEGALLA